MQVEESRSQEVEEYGSRGVWESRSQNKGKKKRREERGKGSESNRAT
jgi:hypothetical protein